MALSGLRTRASGRAAARAGRPLPQMLGAQRAHASARHGRGTRARAAPRRRSTAALVVLGLPGPRSLAFQLREQSVDDLVHRFTPLVLGADDALVVEDVDRRPRAHVPLRRDRAAGALGAVPEAAPGDVLLLQAGREGLLVGIAVHADEGERLVCETLHERPLVRVHGPARASSVAPEVEDHHLAAVVRELEGHAVEVLADDVGRLHADLQALAFELRRA